MGPRTDIVFLWAPCGIYRFHNPGLAAAYSGSTTLGMGLGEGEVLGEHPVVVEDLREVAAA